MENSMDKSSEADNFRPFVMYNQLPGWAKQFFVPSKFKENFKNYFNGKDGRDKIKNLFPEVTNEFLDSLQAYANTKNPKMK